MMVRRNVRTFIILVAVLVFFSSCATTSFDRFLLQSSGKSIDPKLPKLQLETAEAVSIGSSNQVESSSLLYTIFRSEVEDNICAKVGITAGAIGMELIYANVEQNPGWTGKNLAVLEFEVRIFDTENNEIWSGVYSGELDDRDPSLAWRLSFSDQAANNATAKLAHQLIEELKVDISKDYEDIIMYLNKIKN